MAMSFAVRSDVTNKLKEQYQSKLDDMDTRALIKEFFSYLDYTEESDSGKVFNPITIGSCRCLMTEPLSMCLEQMRKSVGMEKENDKKTIR